MSVYYELVKVFKWSLKEIDETSLETLLDFLYYRPDSDPNTRTIKGKTYRRTQGTPSWL